MSWTFTTFIWQWRGPAPFYFVTVPEDASADIRAASKFVTYGWGMIPVTATARAADGTEVTWTTSMFVRNGLYALPIKAAPRQSLGLGEGDELTVRLELRRSSR